jgi:hypothetical protein
MDDGLEQEFAAVDDGLHAPGDSFYENETFWYSFFVPERKIGAWLYAAVRQNAGVTAGGMWIWDDRSAQPWDLPFYQQFSHLKLPSDHSPGHIAFPTGLTVDVREPLMSYDLAYRDRSQVEVDLQFDALEPPVALRSGAPPYPRAHHFDQTGRVRGQVRLDGEVIAVDCYAMRDRSWGPRMERGYHRVGYTWAACPELSYLSYTAPTADSDEIYAGYVRRGDRVSRLVAGSRRIERDRTDGWVRSIDLSARCEDGSTLEGHAQALSHMILPHATAVCVNSSLVWEFDGLAVHGEDQDVWPMSEWRQLRVPGRPG